MSNTDLQQVDHSSASLTDQSLNTDDRPSSGGNSTSPTVRRLSAISSKTHLSVGSAFTNIAGRLNDESASFYCRGKANSHTTRRGNDCRRGKSMAESNGSRSKTASPRMAPTGCSPRYSYSQTKPIEPKPTAELDEPRRSVSSQKSVPARTHGDTSRHPSRPVSPENQLSTSDAPIKSDESRVHTKGQVHVPGNDSSQALNSDLASRSSLPRFTPLLSAIESQQNLSKTRSLGDRDESDIRGINEQDFFGYDNDTLRDKPPLFRAASTLSDDPEDCNVLKGPRAKKTLKERVRQYWNNGVSPSNKALLKSIGKTALYFIGVPAAVIGIAYLAVPAACAAAVAAVAGLATWLAIAVTAGPTTAYLLIVGATYGRHQYQKAHSAFELQSYRNNQQMWTTLRDTESERDSVSSTDKDSDTASEPDSLSNCSTYANLANIGLHIGSGSNGNLYDARKSSHQENSSQDFNVTKQQLQAEKFRLLLDECDKNDGRNAKQKS